MSFDDGWCDGGMRFIAEMSTPTGPLSDFLREHPHAVARHEVLQHWTRHHLDACLQAGTVTRILPAVYCATFHVRHPIVMGEALNLWQPQGLVSGALALHLYAPDVPAPSVADLVVPPQHHARTPPWIRLYRTGESSAQILVRGVRTVEMPSALLRAWSTAPASDRRNLLYLAVWKRICTWRQVRAAVKRAPRLSGRRDIERVLSWFAEGATSPLEVRAKHEVFTGAAFRGFEWQSELRVGNRRAVADMLHREAMVVVELDGDRFHSSRASRASDRNRDTDLAAVGYVTVRFGWDDVVRRPTWCRERLLSVVASRLHHSTFRSGT
jgi:very-short-patch-repair endonuclease